MTLTSPSFFIFFFVLILILSGLRLLRTRTGKQFPATLQKAVLLVASYYYLFTIDPRFCLLIFCITTFVYLLGRFSGSRENRRTRRFSAWGGVSALLFLLLFFKYVGFLPFSFSDSIILPIGISFYTLSAIAYILDISWEKIKPEHNFLDFLLFLSFFPKLTAGPIIRSTEFFPQAGQYRGISLDHLSEGIQIYAFGLFKKLVLADHLGVFVDDVFHAPTAFDTGTVILAAFSYSLQIYLDFSGYSDMAIGLSKILGFDFKPNFNLPYLAKGSSEFWNRWHISLSSWFRDYVYIPLGGSRKGKVRTYGNLMLVMLLSGIWHGSGWTFILWGVLHGVFGCVSHMLRNGAKKRKKAAADAGRSDHKDLRKRGPSRLGSIFSVGITFVIVTLLWVIFRAESVEKACLFFKEMFTIHTGIFQPYTWTFFAVICLVVVSIIAYMRSMHKGLSHINGFYPRLHLTRFSHLTVFFIFVGLIVIMGYFGNTAFIYGQF